MMPNAFNLTRETDRAKVRYIDKDGSKRNAEENIFESNESKESKEHCEQTERVRERERERDGGRLAASQYHGRYHSRHFESHALQQKAKCAGAILKMKSALAIIGHVFFLFSTAFCCHAFCWVCLSLSLFLSFFLFLSFTLYNSVRVNPYDVEDHFQRALLAVQPSLFKERATL